MIGTGADGPHAAVDAMVGDINGLVLSLSLFFWSGSQTSCHVVFFVFFCSETRDSKERLLIHQNLIPVRIRGLPVCIQGGRPETSHMGSPSLHNKIVRILGATYAPPCFLHKLQCYLLQAFLGTLAIVSVPGCLLPFLLLCKDFSFGEALDLS